MKRSVAVLLLSAIVAFPALAHQGGHRTSGVVKEVTASRLVVTDEHGKATTFTLTAATRFLRDQRPAAREQVVVGERVVVSGRDASGTLEAVTVKLGHAPAIPR